VLVSDPSQSYLFIAVGGSVDRACKLEAMLRSLSNRRRELRNEQTKVDNQFIRLMSDLQASLQKDEDLTVILADTFNAAVNNDIVENEENKERSVSLAVSREQGDFIDFQKPTRLERQITPPNTTFRGFGCFADTFNGLDADDAGQQRMHSSMSHPSPSEMIAGAQAWREQNGLSKTDESTGINFRTGMSGHMGLLSTHTRPHEYLETSESHGSGGAIQTTGSGGKRHAPVNFRMMSSHTGLTMSKSRGGILSKISPLRMPGLGSPPAPQDGRGSVQHSGSM
jgi:hypothetical protein